MKKLASSSVLVLALFLGYGCSTDKSNTNTDSVEVAEDSNEAKEDSAMTGTMEDKHEEGSEFLVKAASGGMMEVELGKLAQQKASNADVKAFGNQMVTEHGKANAELKALAAAKNISIPATPGEDHQKHITDLTALNGAEFDKKYMELMLEDHKEDIELFEDATKDNEADADVKAFAQKTLPTLKMHLDMAQKANDKVK